ncbi:MAG: efflux RND transporter periplasmic adaptor subunit [Clostridiales bacterium]|nr:efflux RND transporter periplasmic adaptor subunit [Clostridiales bacterium]
MNIKKILFSVIAVFLLCTVIADGYIKSNIANVDVFVIGYSKTEDSVVSNGTVEYSNTNSIKSKENYMIEEITVTPGDEVKAGDRLVICKTIDSDMLAVSASEAGLSNEQIIAALKGSDYSLISESIDNTKLEVSNEDVVICAENDGIITDMPISEGDIITKNQTLVKMSQNSDKQIVLNINESEISDITKGQQVNITGVGFKDKKYSGTVESISPYAEKANTLLGKCATVKVTVKINDADNDIKCGYTAKCSIITNTDNTSLVVPYDAVLYNNDGSAYVYVYDKGYARKRVVEAGNEYSEGIKIISGIKKGEIVINTPREITESGRVLLNKKHL